MKALFFCLKGKGKELCMFTEKNGLEVMVIGKRIVIYDSEANIVDKAKLNNYSWEVTKE